jgi:predicted PurR-regulated permease PerM
MTRIEQYAQVLLVFLLFAGCWLVLLPSLPAILFSAAIVIFTWPLHRSVQRQLRAWPSAASLLSCLAVTVIVVSLSSC